MRKRKVVGEKKHEKSASNLDCPNPFPYNYLPAFLYQMIVITAPASSGPRMSWIIDFFKGSTLIYCLSMVNTFDRWDNATALTYTAIHGLYGILWVTKSYTFGDEKWNWRVPFWRYPIIATALLGYWIPIYSICSNNYHAPAWIIGLTVFMFGLGVFFHYVSDFHKHLSLILKPKTLITSYLWKKLRNPNYFGELLIYSSFAILSGSVTSALFLGFFVLTFWIPNMILKERSLSRYPEFKDYKDQSWFFIPGIY